MNGYEATFQFGNRLNRYPVQVDFVGGDMHSTGIAFEDYARMGTRTHKLNSGRRGPAPDWTCNDRQLRAIITRNMEQRAYFREALPLTEVQRLSVAQKVLAEKNRPVLAATMGKLYDEYIAAKNAGNVTRERLLIRKVQEIDTQLCLLGDIAKVLAGVVYFYYRCGFNSVDTGHQLGIKPPHVRQLLWRLGKTAGELGYGPPKNRPQIAKRLARQAERKRWERFVRLTESGMTWAMAKQEIGIPAGHNGKVRRVLQKFRLWKPRHHGPQVYVDVKRAARLRAEGYTYQQIVDEMGVSYQTVRRKLKCSGLFKPHHDRRAFGKGRPRKTVNAPAGAGSPTS